MTAPTTTVTNSDGRVFTVRLVVTGERYGLNDVLVHDGAIPMVEFYDATHADDPRFGPGGRGQFVSSYFLTTLIVHPHNVGLDLQGDVPEWKLDAAAVADAITWAHHAAIRAKPGVATGSPPEHRRVADAVSAQSNVYSPHEALLAYMLVG